MRILHTEIAPAIDNPVSILDGDVPFFDKPYHSNPELKIVYIKEGYGTYTIGNVTDIFHKDDLFFLGSNVPHQWNINKKIKPQGNNEISALAVYFKISALGSNFLNMKETKLLGEFLKKATRGIKVNGTTRKLVIPKLDYITKADCFEKIIIFFDILNLLQQSEDLEYISSESYYSLPEIETNRLSDVFNYTKENLNQEITLKKISSVACLSTGAFCRYFKHKTGKTFFAYLNESRISYACELLLNSDLNISQIAVCCGFKTPSNFTKVFKELKGLSPKKFKKTTISGDIS